VNHTASKRFWRCYDALPAEVQAVADKNFKLLKLDPSHPSLQLKPIGGGKMYSARVGLHHRALALPVPDGLHWFWIGTHSEYDKIVA
jgi:hypothetical protein